MRLYIIKTNLFWAIAFGLFFFSLTCSANVGEIMYKQLRNYREASIEYIFLWPNIERRFQEGMNNKNLIQDYIRDIQTAFSTRGLFFREPSECELLVQERNDLYIKENLSLNEINVMLNSGVNYLLYAYLYRVPLNILSFNNVTDVIVFKTIDLRNMRLVNVGMFDFQTKIPIYVLNNIEHASPIGKSGNYPASGIDHLMYLTEDKDLGNFLVDLFHNIQISVQSEVFINDGAAILQSFGKFDQELSEDFTSSGFNVGLIDMLQVPKEEVVYIIVKKYIKGGDIVPVFLYRIHGQNDIHLLNPVHTSIQQIFRNLNLIDANIERIKIAGPVKEDWPYRGDLIREIYRYYLAASGLSIPVNRNNNYSLVVNHLKVNTYRRRQNNLFPVFNYSATLRRDKDGLIISTAVDTIESNADMAMKLNTIQAYNDFTAHRFNRLLNSKKYAEATELIQEYRRNVEKLMPEEELSQNVDRMNLKICSAQITNHVENIVKEFCELRINDYDAEALSLRTRCLNSINSSGCLSTNQKNELIRLFDETDCQ